MDSKKYPMLMVSCILTMSYVHTTNISLHRGLHKLMTNLSKGAYKKALLVSPHFTYTPPLVEAADKGTQITLISQSKKPSRELVQHQNISCLQANVHDKFYCAQCAHKPEHWTCYLGSANFSYRGLHRNRELVVHVDNAACVPGLAQHARALVCRGMIPEDSGIPSETFENDFSELLTESIGHDLKEVERVREHPLLSSTFPLLLSSFGSKDIVTLVSQYIKANHMIHEYRISTMTLNHPDFIRKLRLAALVGDSRIKLIVDSEWAHKSMKSGGEFAKLCKTSKEIGSKIKIRVADKKTVSGSHHAKCLMRKTLYPKSEMGVSIVSSANMTSQASFDSNYAFAIPHTKEQKQITDALEQQFEDWWDTSQEIEIS